MPFIDVEVQSNIVSPLNARYHVWTGETIGYLLHQIDSQQLGQQIDSSVAVLKFHGKVLNNHSTFDDNDIKDNDVLELTIQEPTIY